jgi:5-(carboxyamino)imidazole ribonucleotide mutase
MAKALPVRVGIVMGSRSDWPTLEHAASTLEALGVPFETRVVSAHRTPDLLFEYAETAAERGLCAIIAGAGGAAHLPGMLAAKTRVPILGVPVESKALSGLDSLLSIVQMPAGIPVATFAIGRAGAVNAALFAAATSATADPALAARLEAWRARQTAEVLAHPDPAEPAPAGMASTAKARAAKASTSKPAAKRGATRARGRGRR